MHGFRPKSRKSVGQSGNAARPRGISEGLALLFRQNHLCYQRLDINTFLGRACSSLILARSASGSATG